MVTFDLEITTSACGLLVMTKIARSAGSYEISEVALSSWEPSLLGEHPIAHGVSSYETDIPTFLR